LSEDLYSSIKAYIDDNYIDDIYVDKLNLKRSNKRLEEIDYLCREEVMPSSSVSENVKRIKPKKKSLEDVINYLDETFSEMLLRLIDERGLKDPEVYKRANVTKQTFSKIRNNNQYNPTKQTVLAFAVALELSLDEAKDLLLKSGYALSKSNRFDVIMSYFFEAENYDIHEINAVLFEYDENLLGI
jgi:transcriptional regulator with XRE-family HTH domain